MITALILSLIAAAVLALRCDQLSKRLARRNATGSQVLKQYFRLKEENADLKARLDQTMNVAIQLAQEKGTLLSDKQWAENMLAYHQSKQQQAEAQFKNQYYTLREN